MAHNARLKDDIFYVDGVPIPASYFTGLDTAQSKAVNGDTGGTWNPTNAIIIGGAGMVWATEVLMSGGASIITPLGSGKRIVHAANDVPILAGGHSFATRTIRTSCTNFADANPSSHIGAGGSGSSTNILLHDGPSFSDIAVTIVSGDCSVFLDPSTDTLQSRTTASGFIVPLRVHDGATFTQAQLAFNVTHNATRVANNRLPAIFPKMAVFQVDALGNTTVLGGTVPSGGWVSASANTVAAYDAQQLSIAYPINGTLVVDRSRFAYFAVVGDEAGADSYPNNTFASILCSFSTITNMRFQ